MSPIDELFTGRLIAIGFAGMFAAAFLFLLTEKMDWQSAQRPILALGLLAALYCVTAGISLHLGWQDPLTNVNDTHYARASASGRGRGGIVLLAIRYWPYVLMGLGAFFAYHMLRILRALSKEQRRVTTEGRRAEGLGR
jgi:hypothetical protein